MRIMFLNRCTHNSNLIDVSLFVVDGNSMTDIWSLSELPFCCLKYLDNGTMGCMYVWKGVSSNVDKIIKENSSPIGRSFSHKLGNVLVLFIITGIFLCSLLRIGYTYSR